MYIIISLAKKFILFKWIESCYLLMFLTDSLKFALKETYQKKIEGKYPIYKFQTVNPP